MDIIAYYIGSSLPITILIFIGSYFGLWKRRSTKLSFKETLVIFLSFWILSVLLIILFDIILAGQDELIKSTIGNLWGPLIVGISIGRNIVEWRHKKRADDFIKKSYETN